jgi:hypothetical protein
MKQKQLHQRFITRNYSGRGSTEKKNKRKETNRNRIKGR